MSTNIKLIKKIDDLTANVATLEQALSEKTNHIQDLVKEVDIIKKKYDDMCAKVQESTNAQIKASFHQLRAEVQGEIRMAIMKLKE